MKCAVCFATWPDGDGLRCPQCRYDHGAAGARSAAAVQAARTAFRDASTRYAPDERVSLWDKWRPWAAVALAFVVFVFWLRACGTWGFRLF